ncbi:hypothetical protein ACFXPV_10615 [Streptomyces sp. NPDC059118]
MHASYGSRRASADVRERPWNRGHGELLTPLGAAEGQQLVELLTRVYEA